MNLYIHKFGITLIFQQKYLLSGPEVLQLSAAVVAFENNKTINNKTIKKKKLYKSM